MRIFIPVFLTIFFLTGLLHAAIYKYVDRNGVEHYTDDPDSIPGEYIEKAQVVDINTGKDEKGSADNEKTGIKEKVAGIVRDYASRQVLEIAAILIGLVTAFFFIGKISRSLGYRNVGNIIRIALVLLVMFYMFRHYLDTFREMKDRIGNIKKLTEKRNEAVNGLTEEKDKNKKVE